MSKNQKLENYLSSLEKALGKISVSERADIITEIKSHVLDAMESDENTTVEQILKSLGEPETVANRYLLERGLKPVRRPAHPILKWLTFGFLGTLALVLVFSAFVIAKFSPIVEISDERIVLLGGLIDIDGKNESLKIGNKLKLSDSLGKHLSEGIYTLDELKSKKLNIVFSNARLDIEGTEGKAFEWKCQHSGEKNALNFEIGEEANVLSLRNMKKLECQIKVPEEMKAFVKGTNAKIALNRPLSDTSVDISNGDVQITEDPNMSYQFKTHVNNGSMDDFQSSTDAKAIAIDIRVINGRIAH